MRYLINDDDLEEWVKKLNEVKKHLNEMLELDLANTVEYVEQEMEMYIKDQIQAVFMSVVETLKHLGLDCIM